MVELKFRKYPRAKWHHYDKGIYFVTIVTQNRECRFGHIANGEMELSEEGEIAAKCVQEIPTHYPDVEIHNFVVMPNHVHILLQIVGNDTHSAQNLGAVRPPEHSIDDYPFTERCHFNSNLAKVIGSYKSSVTRMIHDIGRYFKWQYTFHDYIVRDQHAYDNINQYITDNPIRWDNDCLS